jgi:hypothetical protein
MPGELKKRGVLFTDWIHNADGAQLAGGQPDDGAPRAAELALKRAHLFRRQRVVLLEKLF